MPWPASKFPSQALRTSRSRSQRFYFRLQLSEFAGKLSRAVALPCPFEFGDASLEELRRAFLRAFGRIRDLAGSFPAEKMRGWKANSRVGNVRNDEEALLVCDDAPTLWG